MFREEFHQNFENFTKCSTKFGYINVRYDSKTKKLTRTILLTVKFWIFVITTAFNIVYVSCLTTTDFLEDGKGGFTTSIYCRGFLFFIIIGFFPQYIFSVSNSDVIIIINALLKYSQEVHGKAIVLNFVMLEVLFHAIV